MTGNWQPRDNFSRVIDGLSNQIFVGEKHIPLGRFGKCSYTGAGSTPDGAGFIEQDDCSYLSAGAWALGGARATVSRNAGTGGANGYKEFALANPSDFKDDLNATGLTHYGFGSYHPSVSNFLMGDGSVRAFSVSTSVANVLKPLSLVDDGVSVSIP